jgi:glycerophosphoryl diester phosphodiesterase
MKGLATRQRQQQRRRQNASALLAGSLLLAAGCSELPEKGYLARYTGPVHVSHRGGSAELPEHTLYAYDFTLKHHGTDVLEVDVQRTRDGQLVILHDSDLKRVFDIDRKVSEVSSDFIRSLTVAPPREPGALDPFAVEPLAQPALLRVPTLGEVVDRYPGCLLNIEIKDRDPETARLVLQVLQEKQQTTAGGATPFDVAQDVCFASFHDNVGQFLRRRMPQACHTYPVEAAICMTVPRRVALRPEHCPEYDLLVLPPWVISEGLIRSLHASDRRVYVYTVDDKPAMHRLLDWGIDGVMTDRPTRLREVFTERGLESRDQRSEDRRNPPLPCRVAPRPLDPIAPARSPPAEQPEPLEEQSR